MLGELVAPLQGPESFEQPQCSQVASISVSINLPTAHNRNFNQRMFDFACVGCVRGISDKRSCSSAICLTLPLSFVVANG